MNITEAIGAKAAAMAPAILRDFSRLCAEAGERHSDSETQDDYTLLRGRPTGPDGFSSLSAEVLGWTYGEYVAGRHWLDWAFLTLGEDLLLAGHPETERYRLFVRTGGGMVWPFSRSEVGVSTLGTGRLVEVTAEDGPWRSALVDALAAMAQSLEEVNAVVEKRREAAEAADQQREQELRGERAADLERASAAFRR